MISTEASNRWQVWVADDDPTYREWLRHHVDVLCREATISVVSCADLLQRASPLTQAECDLLVVTACFGASPEDARATGLTLLRKLRGSEPRPVIIAVAKEGNELTAVRALQLGAGDYVPKRLLTPELLSRAIQAALERLERRVQVTTIAPESDWAAEIHAAADPDSRDCTVETPAAAAALEAQGDELPLPPELLAGLTLLKRLNSSENSRLYLATSERWGEVALKINKTAFSMGGTAEDAAVRELMAREYATLRAIRSPSVVTIHEFGVRDAWEHLVMEYLPRGNLKARMSQGLPVEETLHYAHAIACALQVIHQAGVLHRDLKPANVMLREDDGVALIDFELTHTVEGSGTPMGLLRGSPYYMSPEHALGEPLDERSDFYSLGIMVYEMLTGKRPYTGASALEVLQAHVSAPPPELPPELSRYDELLARLLAKDRNERFDSSAGIIAALTELRSATLDMAL